MLILPKRTCGTTKSEGHKPSWKGQWRLFLWIPLQFLSKYMVHMYAIQILDHCKEDNHDVFIHGIISYYTLLDGSEIVTEISSGIMASTDVFNCVLIFNIIAIFGLKIESRQTLSLRRRVPETYFFSLSLCLVKASMGCSSYLGWSVRSMWVMHAYFLVRVRCSPLMDEGANFYGLAFLYLIRASLMRSP